MRIDFGTEGYVEFVKSKTSNKVNIIVASRKADNPLELIVNIAEISLKEFIDMQKDIVNFEVEEQ